MQFSFGLIGGGWRSEFYLRIARDLPERFPLAGVVVRDSAKRERLARNWAVPVFATPEELLSKAGPSFVVTSVSSTANFPLLEFLAQRNIPVLSETPVGLELSHLHQVTGLTRGGARIQVAEQYLFQPFHAARLALVRRGQLGTVYEADISVAHGYHGISLLRQYLQVGLRLPRVTARCFSSKIVDGPHRQGPPKDRRVVESRRMIAHIDYGDRLGFFDFNEHQYFSWIRSPQLLVRGEEGEIHGTTVRLLRDLHTPVQFELIRRDTGHGGNLEGYAHQAISGGEEIFYRNPFPGMRWNDDEIAVATSLSKMTDYLSTGESFYGVPEACHDRYLDLLMTESAASGRELVGTDQPWM